MKNIAICFGTRPEIIKLSVLSEKLSKIHNVINIFTGQHTSLYEDVKDLIPNIHYSLNIVNKGILDVYTDVPKKIIDIFIKEKIDLVIVQGDTSSAYICAMTAFLNNIKVGHVEAGLRTFDMMNPFPEEFNRKTISSIAYFHWCPSEISKENLLSENILKNVFVTGNTLVDAVKKYDLKNIQTNNIVVTLHRRENKDNIPILLQELNNIAFKYSEYNFIITSHPNNMVQNHFNLLKSMNIKLIKPLKYKDMLELVASCSGIITDSGGLSEEAVCLKKKTLVCRSMTERPEGIICGISKLIGTNIEQNFEWLLTSNIYSYVNPYGNGDASFKIIDIINDEQNWK